MNCLVNNLDISNVLMAIYNRLYSRFGPQHWWPGDTPFEIIVGAVLTQNTNWKNVERAIANLKQAGMLDIQKIYDLDIETLAGLIRPAGYFNIKAKRLKNLIKFIVEEYSAGLDRMFSVDTYSLRQQLLEINGLGPETVDSILLYAGNKPVFVVDAYTKRIFSRHNICFEDISYDELQSLIESHIERDVNLYNEYHALLVRLGKDYCRKSSPLCENCPIKGISLNAVS